METRIDVFAPFDERKAPPTTVWRFIWHHLREVKGWLVAILITGLLFSGVKSLLYVSVGWLVDLITKNSPEVVWRDYGGWLIAGAIVVLVFRPLVYFANHAVVDQIVVPQITNRIRWRSHVYTLGHALSYFQNDFAGRPRVARHPVRPVGAQRERRGHRRSVVRAGVRVRRARLLRPYQPPARDAHRRLDGVLHRASGLFRAAGAHALGSEFVVAIRRNRPHRRQLHQHRDGEAVRARRHRGRSSVREALRRWAARSSISRGLSPAIVDHPGDDEQRLIVVTIGLSLRLWSEGDVPWRGRGATGSFCAWSDVGLGDRPGARHLRGDRRGAGGDGDDREAAHLLDAPGAQQLG